MKNVIYGHALINFPRFVANYSAERMNRRGWDLQVEPARTLETSVEYENGTTVNNTAVLAWDFKFFAI